MSDSGQINFNQIEPKKALKVMRMIWAALLMGQLAFLAVVVFQPIQPGGSPPPPNLNLICIGALIVIVPAAYLIRLTIFRRGQIPGPIPAGIRPAAYTAGNIIFWAGCESVAFLSLITAMLNHSLMPTIVTAAIALGFQVLTMPMPGKIQEQSA